MPGQAPNPTGAGPGGVYDPGEPGGYGTICRRVLSGQAINNLRRTQCGDAVLFRDELRRGKASYEAIDGR